MSVLTPEVVEILMGLSCPLEEKTALMKALVRAGQAFQTPTNTGVNEETERLRNQSTYAERKRKRDRERRQAERDALRALKGGATAGDRPATADDPPATEGDATATDRDPAPHASAQVVITSSSLRSEDRPPEKPSVSTPKGAKEIRGTRIPDAWSPDFEAALSVGLGGEDARREADKFRDYWRAVPGAKGRKVDWPATWRNWCRTAAENLARKARYERPDPRQAKSDAYRDHLADVAAAMAVGVEQPGRKH